MKGTRKPDPAKPSSLARRAPRHGLAISVPTWRDGAADPTQRLLPGVPELRQPLTRANVRRQGVFSMAKKSTAIRTTQRFETDAPQLSDASLARIRAYARRYVRAGRAVVFEQRRAGVDVRPGGPLADGQDQKAERWCTMSRTKRRTPKKPDLPTPTDLFDAIALIVERTDAFAGHLIDRLDAMAQEDDAPNEMYVLSLIAREVSENQQRVLEQARALLKSAETR
jgi:hypothetical protein